MSDCKECQERTASETKSMWPEFTTPDPENNASVVIFLRKQASYLANLTKSKVRASVQSTSRGQTIIHNFVLSGGTVSYTLFSVELELLEPWPCKFRWSEMDGTEIVREMKTIDGTIDLVRGIFAEQRTANVVVCLKDVSR